MLCNDCERVFSLNEEQPTHHVGSHVIPDTMYVAVSGGYCRAISHALTISGVWISAITSGGVKVCSCLVAAILGCRD